MDLDPLFIYFNRSIKIILKVLVLAILIGFKKKNVVLSGILNIYERFYMYYTTEENVIDNWKFLYHFLYHKLK